MLGYLPTGYVEETIYSISARYEDECGYLDRVAVARELFGSAFASAGLDIVANLGHLVQQLPHGHRLTIDRLIDNHTLLPYYEPFMSVERVQTLRDDMTNNRVNSRTRTGIGFGVGKGRTLERLRFCPDCAEQDWKEKGVGEPYWHRIHQIPTTLVCPYHRVFLEDSDVAARRNKSYRFITARRAIDLRPPRRLDPTNRCHVALLALTQDSAWLLAHPHTGLHLRAIQERHRRLLYERDYAGPHGRVLTKRLVDGIRVFFGDDVLSLLGCALNDDPGSNWVKRLTYTTDNTVPPIHHLLLIHFLGYRVEEYFALSDDVTPFGEAPWPCLNGVSEHYRQDVVHSCTTRYARVSQGRRQAFRPIGRFTCSCGFVYERTGPDRVPEDRYRYTVVIDRGGFWKDTLRGLWHNGAITMKEIARCLGAGETYIRDQALLLGLPFPRMGGRNAPNVREQPRRPRRRASPTPYRNKWGKMRLLHPQASVSELIDLDPGVYTWLYAHDRDWLNVNKPKPRRVVQETVNWKQRDEDFARLVRDTADRMRAAPERPQRITINAIGLAINHQDTLLKKLHKLPETTQVLTDVTETFEDWAIRRLWWTVAQHQQQGTCPTASQLRREAGLRNVAGSPKVSKAFEEAWRVLSHPEKGDS